MKPVVLILIGAFYPGHDATGPNMSIRALCELLADQFEFRLVARDRPPGGAHPLVESGSWQDLGFAQIQYLPVGKTGAVGLNKLLRETPHDVLILNSFFCREFTIPALVLRRLGTGSRAPVILSPRGEFSQGALDVRGGRKANYLRLTKATGLLRGVILHTTSDDEEGDVRVHFPTNQIVQISNARPTFPIHPHVHRAPGAPLRVAFLARVVPLKGLDVALDALAQVDTPVDYTIYGPLSEPDYWAKCTARIAELPPHIRVTHGGELANADVPAAMAQQDLMFLPSRSENFGHAIFEALCSATPVLIGIKTPWRNLAEAQAGFDVPLEDRAALARAVEQVAAMSQTEMAQWRRGARRYAEAFLARNDAAGATARLLHQLADSQPHQPTARDVPR